MPVLPAHSRTRRLHIHAKPWGRIQGRQLWYVLGSAGSRRTQHQQVVGAAAAITNARLADSWLRTSE